MHHFLFQVVCFLCTMCLCIQEASGRYAKAYLRVDNQNTILILLYLIHPNLLIADRRYPTPVGSSTNKTNIKIQSASTKKKHTVGTGLLSKIFSIFSMISGVSLGRTSNALRFSRTCSGFDAPRMTVDVLGFLATHASASAVGVVPSSVSTPNTADFNAGRLNRKRRTHPLSRAW